MKTFITVRCGCGYYQPGCGPSGRCRQHVQRRPEETHRRKHHGARFHHKVTEKKVSFQFYVRRLQFRFFQALLSQRTRRNSHLQNLRFAVLARIRSFVRYFAFGHRRCQRMNWHFTGFQLLFRRFMYFFVVEFYQFVVVFNYVLRNFVVITLT